MLKNKFIIVDDFSYCLGATTEINFSWVNSPSGWSIYYKTVFSYVPKWNQKVLSNSCN